MGPPARRKTIPGIVGAFETAEAAFVFGLPGEMNYAVMYTYVIDRKSWQRLERRPVQHHME